MPIFQDDLDLDLQPRTKPTQSPHGPEEEALDDNSGQKASFARLPLASPPSARLRRLSEESLRTELCEGPVPDSPARPSTPESGSRDAVTSDRAELIERLKRGESPTWVPNRHIESLYSSTNPDDLPNPSRISPQSSTLLPPAQITPERPSSPRHLDQQLHDGLEIQRPRSALHSGDFTRDHEPQPRPTSSRKRSHAETRPTVASNPWLATSPPRDFTPFAFERRIPFSEGPASFRSGTSPLSSSISSSFAYQPPTSPLVQSESNDDFELSMPLEGMDLSSGRVNPRRFTMASASSPSSISPSPRLSMPSRTPLHRREGSLPSQAHQPRRSLTSTPSFLQSGSSPQTPALRSRRPSFGSDSSPLQHASMVGSYEESILRGRMSTTPSKPLDFLAQIGVLGKGKCKSSLRCPAHVTLPFAAVYYSYNSTAHGRSRSDDGPSPYVGQVDLENGLQNVEEVSRSRRKAQARYADRMPTDGDLDMITGIQDSDLDRGNKARPKHRSNPPKAPPGGSYRIPEKGQLQIIIKNQNKTAVKLFLVPYDLTGMEPGTKTFIRQRIYSAGPIIDTIPGTSATTSSGLDSLDRPILRYLIHLHICSPSRGRFYLYKSIRVVFANRVPDGKEKLRNETTWPEPRFTPYKPIRVMHPPVSSSSGPGAMLTAEKAFRRRSLGVSVGATGGGFSQGFDTLDGIYPPLPSHRVVSESSAFSTTGRTLPVDAIPLHLPARRRPTIATSETPTSPSTPSSSTTTKNTLSPADSSWRAVAAAQQYEKLSKGDSGYGGNVFGFSMGGSPGGGGPEGLLSQRLRSLGVKTPPSSSSSTNGAFAEGHGGVSYPPPASEFSP